MPIVSHHMQGRRLGRLAAAAALSLVLGCEGESGPPRLPVAGQVTLDGKPLASGTIAFIPADKGLGASGPIQDGAFAIPRSEGLHPGKYKVDVVSVQGTGKQIRSPDDPTATIDEERNLIPPRYSRESLLQAEVKAEAENSFRFELSSREEKTRGRRVAGSGGPVRGATR